MTLNLTNEQRRILSAKRITMEVSPFEAEFIKQMRKYAHGRVTAVILDGIPFKIETNISQMLFEETDAVDTLKKVIK